MKKNPRPLLEPQANESVAHPLLNERLRRLGLLSRFRALAEEPLSELAVVALQEGLQQLVVAHVLLWRVGAHAGAAKQSAGQSTCWGMRQYSCRMAPAGPGRCGRCPIPDVR